MFYFIIVLLCITVFNLCYFFVIHKNGQYLIDSNGDKIPSKVKLPAWLWVVIVVLCIPPVGIITLVVFIHDMITVKRK